MKVIINFILFLLISCGQDYNSSTFDQAIYGDQSIDTSTPEGQRFAKAFQIIENKCISCHTSTRHTTYAALTTSQKWIDSGNISKGDYNNSLIKVVLKNYPGGDMPQGSSELSQSELDTLRDWIDNIP